MQATRFILTGVDDEFGIGQLTIGAETILRLAPLVASEPGSIFPGGTILSSCGLSQELHPNFELSSPWYLALIARLATKLLEGFVG